MVEDFLSLFWPDGHSGGHVSRHRHGKFASIDFNDHQIKELKYAALLHDFGKVGVRESVLTKAKKLHDYRLKIIQQNILLIKENLKRQFYQNIGTKKIKLMYL